MEKVIELLQDEAFVAELDKLEEEKDILALFESRGATVTMDQLQELIAQISRTDEISDDDLDKVAGGVRLTVVGPITLGITIRTLTPTFTRTVITWNSRRPYCRR